MIRSNLRFLALLVFVLLPVSTAAQRPTERSAVLYGFVREAETGEPIARLPLSVDEGAHHVVTNRDGYFSIPHLSRGEHRLRARVLGFAPLDTLVTASGAPIEIRLRAVPVELAGITVEGARAGERPFETPEVSVQTVTPAQVRRVPAALEADLFRSIQALPGVISPGVLSSRLLVRGGAADQNLFLLDGFPVIYPYHLAGAFSTFHIDAVRDAEFWIGVPPARYGGRLSSVLDVALRDGNRERLTGAASLGLVSSSAVVEGPHPRGAWFVGARRTYIDQIVRGGESEVPYHFYDAYAKSYVDLGPADRLSALVFLGQDATWRAGARERDYFNWSNDVYGLSWRHLFGGRAVFEQRISLSRFTQQLEGGYSSRQGARIGTDHHTSLAAAGGELRAALGDRQQVQVGYSVERQVDEHRTAYEYGYPTVLNERVGRSAGTLLAAYVQDDITVNDALRIRLGLRGEKSGRHRSLQPRIATKYLLSDRIAFTAGAGVLRQYTHLLQDSDANYDVYNVDIWISAHEPGVSEGRSTHLVTGVEAALPWDLRFRAEGYRKSFSGLITLAPYDPLNQRLATERLENATGLAQGLDLSLGREGAGPVRGWIGYSLAASTRTVQDASFAADPHPRQRFVAVWDAETKRKWGFTGRFEAMEGVPFTPAVAMVPERPFDFSLGRFSDQCYAIEIEYLYGPRNSARTGWSKRLDLGTGRRWTDRRGWNWELSLSLLNALFDPTGVFRPAPANRQEGCDAPAEVVRERELLLPPIPSVAVRVEF